jgi:hypothetical protein
LPAYCAVQHSGRPCGFAPTFWGSPLAGPKVHWGGLFTRNVCCGQEANRQLVSAWHAYIGVLDTITLAGIYLLDHKLYANETDIHVSFQKLLYLQGNVRTG